MARNENHTSDNDVHKHGNERYGVNSNHMNVEELLHCFISEFFNLNYREMMEERPVNTNNNDLSHKSYLCRYGSKQFYRVVFGVASHS